MQEIDSDLDLTGALIQVYKNHFNLEWRKNKVQPVISNDSTKVLLLDKPLLSNQLQYKGEQLKYTVYNESFDELFSDSITLPYEGKYVNIQDHLLGIDGSIYLLTRISLEKRTLSNIYDPYLYEILKIKTQEGGTVTRYDLNIPDKSIQDIKLMLDGEALVCAGFYGDLTSKTYRIKGVFTERINLNTNEVEGRGLKAFDMEFISGISGKHRAEKGMGLTNSFEVTDFIKRGDGGMYLISEFRQKTESGSQNAEAHSHSGKSAVLSNGGYTQAIYGSIIVTGLNDGSILWYAEIPKYQMTKRSPEQYFSYLPATTEQNLYFVINDHLKNLYPNKDGKVQMVTDDTQVAPLVITVSVNGKISKRELTGKRENIFTLEPGSLSKVGDGLLVAIASEREKKTLLGDLFPRQKLSLVRLTFE